jgi:hypothetical protein
LSEFYFIFYFGFLCLSQDNWFSSSMASTSTPGSPDSSRAGSPTPGSPTPGSPNHSASKARLKNFASSVTGERVLVGVRVRPFIQREVEQGFAPCFTVEADNKISVGQKKALSFDWVFDDNSTQEQVKSPLLSAL